MKWKLQSHCFGLKVSHREFLGFREPQKCSLGFLLPGFWHFTVSGFWDVLGLALMENEIEKPTEITCKLG